jgi:D-proline reductase (dithiol) PrdB
MCNQSVGLIASIIEKAGIPTVDLSLLREVTEKVKPPRTLFVPFAFGYPFGQPNNPTLQHDIIRAALVLFETPELLPIYSDFHASQEAPSLR